MFFEGSEKKIEVIFDRSLPSLRSQPKAVWQSLVQASQAQILSQVSNDKIDAYLLSESSLFIYDHYLVMITCGTTQLVNAVSELMTRYQPQDIQAFFYERKNELLPQAQKTDFFKDTEILKKWFDGESLRFGREDEHHLYLFASKKNYTPASDDQTLEVLMHGIDPKVIDQFTDCEGCDPVEFRQRTGITEIVRGDLDDYFFDPVGYSLNAIDGSRYYTIHITPENHGSYISFETNAIPQSEQAQWAQKVLQVFKPVSFDLVFFNTTKSTAPQFDKYTLKRQFAEKLKSGYETQYFSFYKPNKDEQRPVRF